MASTPASPRAGLSRNKSAGTGCYGAFTEGASGLPKVSGHKPQPVIASGVQRAPHMKVVSFYTACLILHKSYFAVVSCLFRPQNHEIAK